MAEDGMLGSGHYEQRFVVLLDNFKFYKFPLVIAAGGILLLLISIILLIKSNTSNQEVIFSQEASSSATKDNKIRVDIEGAVRSPGIYSLPQDSRIADALIAVGGLTDKANHDWIAKNLNRAAKLLDGGKIYIPSLKEASEGKISNIQYPISNKIQSPNSQSNQSLGVSISLVNINSASQTELEALPGIGPVTAGKIISSRPYQTLEELTGRKVVGKALFEKIKNLINI